MVHIGPDSLGEGVCRGVQHQSMGPDGIDVCWDRTGSIEPVAAFAVALDLTDATGRAHAAWWLSARCPDGVPSIGESRRAVLLAKGGYEMSGDLIRALRLVCLHVAGMGAES